VEEVGLEEKEGGAWHFTRMSRPDTIIAEGWADTREHWREEVGHYLGNNETN
jgi:hypothetical protein